MERELERLKIRLSWLEKKLGEMALASYTGNAPQAAEFAAFQKDMEELRGEISRLEQMMAQAPPQRMPQQTLPQQAPQQQQTPQQQVPPQQAAYGYRLPSPAGNAGHPLPVPEVPPAQEQEQKQRRFTEGNLGRYVVGGLAVILTLFALGAFVAAAWDVLPVQFWYGLLMLASAGIEAGGFLFMRKNGTAKGFWSSVAALGAGMALLLAAGGAIALELYPASVAGILACVWFAVQCWAAFDSGSRFFYGFSCVGALASLWVTALWCEMTVSAGWPDGENMQPVVRLFFEAELTLAVIAAALSLIGVIAPMLLRKRYPDSDMKPSGFSTVFLGLFWAVLAAARNRVFWHGYEYDTRMIFFLLAVIGAAFLVRSQSPGFLNLAKHKSAVSVAGGLLGSLMVTPSLAGLCSLKGFPGEFSAAFEELALSGAFFAVICLAAFLSRDRKETMLAGASLCIFIRLGSLSWQLWGVTALLPGSAALVLSLWLFAGTRSKNGENPSESICRRIVRVGFSAVSACLAWGEVSTSGFLNLKETDFNGLALLGCCVAGAACLLSLVNIVRQDKGRLLPLASIEALLMCVCFGISAGQAAMSVTGIDALSPALALAAVMSFKAVMRGAARSGAEAAAFRVLCFVFSAIAHLALLLECAFSSWNPDGKWTEVTACLAFLYCAGISLKDAVMAADKAEKRTLEAVSALLSANCSLWCGLGAIDGIPGLAVSVAGAALGAAFVFAGFYYWNKSLRVSGLCCLIVYVLKACVADIMSMGWLAVSGGLLAAGAICFGVSALYYRMNKRYEREGREGKEERKTEG